MCLWAQSYTRIKENDPSIFRLTFCFSKRYWDFVSWGFGGLLAVLCKMFVLARYRA